MKYNTYKRKIYTSSFALLGLLCLLLIPFSSADAYFGDKETSSENLFRASSVEMALSVSSEGSRAHTFSVANMGGLPFNYGAHVTETSDQLVSFCGEINVTLDGSETDLLSFMSAPSALAVGDTENLDLEFSVDDPSINLSGKVCTVEFIFEASQEGYSHGEAFFDTKIHTLTLYGEDYGTNPPPPYDGPDVVINEVMWMGSISDEGDLLSKDEWIELRNMTNAPIDIGKWEIENLRKNGNTYMIPASHTLPAHGFFLISNNPEQANKTLVASVVDQANASMRFNNDYSDNGALVLKDADGVIVDETPVANTSDWPAGEHSTSTPQAWSMERNDDPLTGWHTCDPSSMTAGELTLMEGYWKEDGRAFNCGTPGAPNLSSNDPSSESFIEPLSSVTTSPDFNEVSESSLPGASTESDTSADSEVQEETSKEEDDESASVELELEDSALEEESSTEPPENEEGMISEEPEEARLADEEDIEIDSEEDDEEDSEPATSKEEGENLEEEEEEL